MPLIWDNILIVVSWLACFLPLSLLNTQTRVIFPKCISECVPLPLINNLMPGLSAPRLLLLSTLHPMGLASVFHTQHAHTSHRNFAYTLFPGMFFVPLLAWLTLPYSLDSPHIPFPQKGLPWLPCQANLYCYWLSRNHDHLSLNMCHFGWYHYWLMLASPTR